MIGLLGAALMFAMLVGTYVTGTATPGLLVTAVKSMSEASCTELTEDSTIDCILMRAGTDSAICLPELHGHVCVGCKQHFSDKQQETYRSALDVVVGRQKYILISFCSWCYLKLATGIEDCGAKTTDEFGSKV